MYTEFHVEGRPSLSATPMTGIESRVIGGRDADIREFPWQCSMRFAGSHSCGCIILSADKVLTANHCIQGR